MERWIFILIAVIVTFFVAAVFVFPKIFLKNKYNVGETYDRGIKKYRIADNERGIVYQPALKIRKYIDQYILVGNDSGEKYIKCKINKNVEYLDYDIVLFGSNNKVFKVLHVKDIIQQRGYTEEVSLPAGTSYVTILLNAVNNKRFTGEKSVSISIMNLVCFDVLVTALFAYVGWCINISFSYLFGGIFRESYAASTEDTILAVAVSAAIGAIITTIVSLILIYKNKKK